MTDFDESDIGSSPTRRRRLYSPVHARASRASFNSTARQYALAERARELGRTAEQVQVIDEDLGVSGSVVSLAKRTGLRTLITGSGTGASWASCSASGLASRAEQCRLVRPPDLCG